MNVVTYEAVVEDGRARLPPGVNLPEKTTVYVVVPGMKIERRLHFRSPRLANPADAARFEVEVIEESKDAGL